uniref:Uncharacterized protein n=1 Tax=Electrophorus electricus TaxID=8005 RepID=A0AAY5EQB7_ELEEL
MLSSALQSAHSPLRGLDLSNNDLHDSGVELLCAGLESSRCKLEIVKWCLLKCIFGYMPLFLSFPYENMENAIIQHVKWCLVLSGCLVTEEGCSYLASALSSNPSHLKELDLTYNNPGDTGVNVLSARLEDPHCKLETLKLSGCGLTGESCKSLTSVLQTENSLKELELNNNDLQDSGVEELCAGLTSLRCILEILGQVSS